MVKTKQDLTGKIFGRLKVLEQAEDAILPCGQKVARWLCECQCEKKTRKIVPQSYLKNGSVKSCGCIVAETKGKRKTVANQYKIFENYVIGYTPNNQEFFIDKEDLPIVEKYNWYMTSKGYICSHINGKSIQIQNVILPPQENKVIDHKDRNPRNNRKINLRYATKAENNRNTNLSINNTSEIIGVNWREDQQRWIARITVDYIRKNLGSFVKKEDAIIARLKAEKEFFGEFAPQKHLFDKYHIMEEEGD